MKIAMVTAFFPPNVIGGAEISSYYLSKVLAEKGHEVHIIAPDFGKKRECLKFKKENTDLNVHYMNYPFFIKNDVIRMRLLAYNPFFLVFFLIKILKIVVKNDIDIIHAHEDEDNIVAWLASKITRRPIIITLRDWRFICEMNLCAENGEEIKVGCNFIDYIKCNIAVSKKSRLKIFYFFGVLYLYIYMHINKLILNRVDRIIVVSNFAKKVAIKSGLINKKLKTIYDIIMPNSEMNEIYSNDFYDKNYKIISFAGRLDSTKGVHILIQAFKDVRVKIKCKLIIIGETNNEYSTNLKYLVKKLDLESDVIFFGRVPHKQVLNFFKKSDIVVVPSILPESQGRTVLEALLVKTPVVASDVGGISELVDKSEGLLVRPNDKNALVKGILTILTRETKIQPDVKKHLSINFIYEQTKKVYQDAIDLKYRHKNRSKLYIKRV
jgi:glycosyltransferase involved in cell wall biosynthesis